MKMCLSKETKLHSEKGFISIFMLLFVIAIAGVVVTQVPSFYDSLNTLRSEKKVWVVNFAQLHQLILGLKMKRTMFLIDSTCARYPDHTIYTSNSISLCVNPNVGICVDVDGAVKQCISLEADALDWQKGKGEPVAITGKAEAVSTYKDNNESEGDELEGGKYAKGTVKNKQASITIPATTDTQIWRKCTDAGAGCVKVSLCPQHATDVNCSAEDVLSETVVRLGEL